MSHSAPISGAVAAPYPPLHATLSPADGRAVVAHAAAIPRLHAQDVFERRRTPFVGLRVNDVWHPARTVADIMPGDIGFYYKKKGQDYKQRLISWGESFINASQSEHRGDASVLHAYIVLQSYPLLNQLLVADAAGGPNDALGTYALLLDFTGRDKDPFDVDSYHLYYRFKDPRLRTGVATRAKAWSRHKVANFALGHALSSPWRVKYLLPMGRRRIRHLLKSPPFDGPVPDIGARPKDKKPYKVMCSEFVACVYIPEIINLFCEDHRLTNPLAGLNMGGLKDGAAGSVFNCDPRYLVPSSLQGRLSRASQVTCVGVVPPAYVTP